MLHPEYKVAPRVYYMGLLNRYFIAGAVHNPEANECLEGATVTLTNEKAKKQATLKTDKFGDF